MNRHWTVEELVDQLYGVRDRAELEMDAHLASCGKCSAHLAELQRRRAEVTGPAPVSAAVLRAQRSAVFARAEAPLPRVSPRVLAWIPALSAACLLTVGALVYRPTHTPPPHPETSDAQLFADIYNLEESAEPRAAAPIHELFEEGLQ